MTSSTSEDVSAKIRLKAMNLIARREYSRKELESKLLVRFGEQEQVVSAVLAKLESDGLLSDLRFVESFIRSGVRKGRGPQRILNELVQKGIAESVAREHLRATDTDWFELASIVLEKKFGNLPNKLQSKQEQYQLRARQMRFLQYRGFTHEQIRGCIED